jgi:two-component system, NtrC family, C4-dicarboxylate transport response regulator DctD
MGAIPRVDGVALAAPMAPPHLIRELMAHLWAGNVRELRNIADRFVLGVLRPPYLVPAESELAARSLADQVDEFERCIIVEQLRRCHGSVAAASEALSIPKKTLYDKVHRYAINLELFRSAPPEKA